MANADWSLSCGTVIYGYIEEMDTLRSKFALPEMADHLIDRPRLRQALMKNRHARLFVLKAPAGYGKSTLALQAFRHATAIRSGWIHLDTLDKDLWRFSAHLIEALSQLFPIIRHSELAQRLVELTLRPEIVAKDILLLLEEYQGLDGWLTLDNWEAVNDSAEVNTLIGCLIRDNNTPLRIIITTRVKPRMKLRKLEEQGQVVLFTERELGFTLPESNAVVRQISRQQIGDSQLEQIWRMTKGWCVASSLVARSISHQGRLCPDDITGLLKRSESIHEYAEEELFCDLSEELKLFLAQLSTLEILSPEGCKEIVGDTIDVISSLEQIRRSTLPLTVLPGELRLRLHPMVRQAANVLLHKLFPRERVAERYLATIDYYREQGLILEAVELALQLPDYQKALEIIDSDWFGIIAANGISPFERWLERFPSELREHAIYVKTKANLLSQQGNNQELIRYLSTRITDSCFADDPMTHVSLWTRFHWARLNTINGAHYDAIKSEWTNLIGEIKSLGSMPLAGVEVVLCVAAYTELRISEAKTHALNALEYVGADGPADYAAGILDNLAVLEHTCGDKERAIEILRKNDKESRERNSYYGIPLRLFNLAWIHISSGALHEGLLTLAEGRQFFQTHTPSNYYALLFAERYEGVARWLLGQQEEGLCLLEQSLQHAAEYCQGERNETALLLDYYSSLTGDSTKSGLSIAEIKAPADEDKSESQLIHLAKEAYAALASNDYSSAQKSAERLSNICATHGLRPWSVTASFLLGKLVDSQEKADECLRYISEGLETLAEIHWRLYPLPNNALTAFVVTRALRDEINTKVAKALVGGDVRVDLAPWFGAELEDDSVSDSQKARLLSQAAQMRVRGLVASAMVLAEGATPELRRASCEYLQALKEQELPPLHITTLGRFEVVAQNRPVVFRRKKSQLMFQILLTEYPGSVHEETIVETLWPESEPSKGKSALRTCVKDLRKALDPYYSPRGTSYITYADQRYAFVASVGSFLDAYEFEKKLGEVASDVGDNASCVEKTLDLFTGEYLNQLYFESFAVEKREHLLGRFLNCAVRYCENKLATDEFECVFSILQKGLRFNPLWGEGVQLLIQAYVKKKELVNAIRLYRSYEQTLKADLGVAPDEELRVYFEQIVVSGD